jgi:4-amino-4-deoxy-L-arabinose transferase-like glycosyltransferase
MKKVKLQNVVCWVMILAIAYFIVMEVLLCLAPPIARDALIHHLAIPKLWLIHGGFYETPWAVYSYYPMNIDLLYLIPLALGNDVVPHFIHMAFGLGTAVLIYLYLNRRFGRTAGILGSTIFISTPVIAKLSTMAYVDLGLVFFITASVLAFLRWRDGEYRELFWMLTASVAMGLALGTKYNGLVAWFFMTMAIVFIYSRDTGDSRKAFKAGLLFFILSLVVFSPWLVKNSVLTNNPFYPLFSNIFSAIASRRGGDDSTVFGQVHVSLFQMREILYQENFWEVLLIPFRIFFQGQDDTPRYFDGVLNPILILFVPFAFMQRERKTEKLLFLFFGVFFIVVTFFLDQIRIRYILPAIPFLAILSAAGLVNIFQWLSMQKKLLRAAGMAVLAVVTAGLLGFNAAYLQHYFKKISPVDYLMKKESRDDFIARHDGSYPAMVYINNHTPEDSRIVLVLLAGRGYYLNRDYREERSAGMGMDMIRSMVEYSRDEKTFQKYLASLDCTHLLIRYHLFQQFLKEQYDPETIRQLEKRMNTALKKIYDDSRYAVFCLNDG